jgi:hypothetical protein
MNVSSIGHAAAVPTEAQAPVNKPAVSQAPASTPPAYTVSLSSAAQKASSGDVDHDGDSH